MQAAESSVHAIQNVIGCDHWVPSLLSAEEAAELQLQHAYLAFLWGRAFRDGTAAEPQASRLATVIAAWFRPRQCRRPGLNQA
jgi:hypothetical protein